MDDLISRQAAIEALRYAQHRFTVADEAGGIGTVKWSEDVIYFAAAERVLTELPSAQPERNKGKWIKQPYKSDKYVIFRCSACLMESGFGHIESKWANYCPNCGADMRGEE